MYSLARRASKNPFGTSCSTGIWPIALLTPSGAWGSSLKGTITGISTMSYRWEAAHWRILFACPVDDSWLFEFWWFFFQWHWEKNHQNSKNQEWNCLADGTMLLIFNVYISQWIVMYYCMISLYLNEFQLSKIKKKYRSIKVRYLSLFIPAISTNK